MADFKIGVMADSFRVGFYNGLVRAKAVGADGVQVYTVSDDMAPWNMDKERRNEVKEMLAANGLVASALCGDLGGHGFMNKEENPSKIDKSKQILDLSKELGCNIVTTHIGIVPEDKTCDTYKIMQEACYALAQYADEIGAKFAVETGPESPEVLRDFLDSLNSKGVSVNYDPANLVMVACCDPVKGVHTLKDYIIHTHAKDGINLAVAPPEKMFSGDGFEYYRELPLGKGGVDFPAYIAALKEIGYNGFLTIERECGDDPQKDIQEAVQFLKKLI